VKGKESLGKEICKGKLAQSKGAGRRGVIRKPERLGKKRRLFKKEKGILYETVKQDDFKRKPGEHKGITRFNFKGGEEKQNCFKE